jgi:thioredoxin reductase
MPDPAWDCVVVGGGAAGLSAALVLGRARRRVLLLDQGEQANLPAPGIGGLLGFDGVPPAELYARGRTELAAYPTVSIQSAEVVGGGRSGDGFVVSIAGGDDAFQAARVLLAPGMDYELPDIPGIAELWGRSVFHCPYCHGWEHRDRPLAVLGSPMAAHSALLLRGWSEDVVLLTGGPDGSDGLAAVDRDRVERAGVEVIERPVVGLRGRGGRLEAVLFADGGELAREGLLAFTPLRQRSSLARELGAALTESDRIDVDQFGQTTVPGLYAAGDVSLPGPHLAGAIAAGSLTGAVINEHLVVAEHGGEPMIPPRV